MLRKMVTDSSKSVGDFSVSLRFVSSTLPKQKKNNGEEEKPTHTGGREWNSHA